jgi:hypothetical protein
MFIVLVKWSILYLICCQKLMHRTVDNSIHIVSTELAVRTESVCSFFNGSKTTIHVLLLDISYANIDCRRA